MTQLTRRTGVRLFVPMIAIMTTAAFADYVDECEPLVKKANSIKNYPIVVFGEFILAEETDINPFESRQVSTTFRIDESFKGFEERETIAVKVHSDQLAYPGEAISTYAKRIQMQSELYEKGLQTEKQMDSLRVSWEENEIGDEEFQERKSEIEADYAKLNRDYMAIPEAKYHIVVSHGKTFYDRGGSIMQKRKYLLVFNLRNDTEYYVSQGINNGNTSIFWGDEAVQLAEQLRKMQDVTYELPRVCWGF